MIKLQVTGMTCGHCAMAVKEALRRVPGVEKVEVELQCGEAVIEGSPEPQALCAAVREQGYEATVVQ